MKGITILLLSILLTTGNLKADTRLEKVFIVGVVPQFEARKLHSIWRPILNYLENETGYTFKLRGSPSIPEFEKQFIQAEFDFAYMNPYHLVIANDIAGYIPLVRDHGRQLFGVLVVKKDSDIKSPDELKGKKVAFPAPNALAASMQIRQELLDKFDTDVIPLYVKTHDSVYLSVLLGQSAAGGGVQKTLNQQSPENRDALRVIHSTQKVTPHPFAALPSVPEDVRKAVISAFMKLGDTESGRSMLRLIPIKKIGTASIQDYASLKKMGLERFFVKTY